MNSEEYRELMEEQSNRAVNESKAEAKRKERYQNRFNYFNCITAILALILSIISILLQL